MSTDSKQGRITALYAWAALQQKEYNLAYEVITKKVSWHIFTELFQLLLRTKGNDLLSWKEKGPLAMKSIVKIPIKKEQFIAVMGSQIWHFQVRPLTRYSVTM